MTAWLSVGVGEFVAFYLILRRYDVTLAVAIAVVISAATVWSAAPQHFLIDPRAAWGVVVARLLWGFDQSSVIAMSV